MSDEWKKIERNAHNFEEEIEFVGVFLGTVESQFELDNYLFNKNGKEVIVFGKTALKTKMSAVEPGQVVKIVYLGKKKSQKSKREYDDFEVYIKK